MILQALTLTVHRETKLSLFLVFLRYFSLPSLVSQNKAFGKALYFDFLKPL